jgi:phospholipid/cholesterol/gamma-HCH transport system substrate-binding protein
MRISTLGTTRRTVLVGLLVALLVVLGLVLRSGTANGEKTVTAYFPRAVSIFEGSEVRILGVRVGTVTAVVPDGETVRVEMSYDGQYKLPDDVRAVIITPTLTADRFIQLTPAYESGPVLDSGGQIEVERTGTPIELDRIYRSLSDLTRALGPDGANKDGSLDRVLEAGTDFLGDRGAKANQTINDLALTLKTLGDGSEELFATVESLHRFTRTLARNDATVARFISNLGGVSQELAKNDEQLVSTLQALAGILDDVDRFVSSNRALLVTDVKRLVRVTGVLADYSATIEDVVAIAPLALGNLTNARDPRAGITNSRVLLKEGLEDADALLCTMVRNGGVAGADTACKLFDVLLEPIIGHLLQSGRTGGTTSFPAQRSGVGPSLLEGDYAQTFEELLGAKP